MKNIGLYFGTFNPVHVGHLIIANHLVSAINSLLLASKYNRLELGMELNPKMNPTLTLSYKF